MFSIDLSTGTLKLLHSFGKATDGYTPNGSLTRIGNKLYGTTAVGGTGGQGTVYCINLETGAYKSVYSFRISGVFGAHPFPSC